MSIGDVLLNRFRYFFAGLGVIALIFGVLVLAIACGVEVLFISYVLFKRKQYEFKLLTGEIDESEFR